jgi:hypothetical protein
MNSEQERIVAELLSRSLGAPFLFAPSEYRIGKTSHKPCDLVWVGNGCTILFSMIESSRSREKMARHNFNRLKGGYKEWFGGRNLKGRNAYSSFDIPFDPYSHKIFISVVTGGEASAEINPEIGEELANQGFPPPTLCATIPQTVLDYLAANGGSALDLLLYLDELRAPYPLSAELSIKALRRRHNLCFNDVPSDLSWRDFRDNPRLYGSDSVYKTLRTGGNAATPDSLASFLLSDLDWSQTMRVVSHIKLLERKAASLPPSVLGIRAASCLLDFPPYLVGLIVHRFRGSADFDGGGEHAALLLQSIQNHSNFKKRFCLLLHYNVGEQDHRSISGLLVPSSDDAPLPLMSQTTSLLDRIRTLSVKG